MALPKSVPWFVLPRSAATWTGPTLLNCWALLLQASNAVAFKSAATTNSWHHFRWLAQCGAPWMLHVRCFQWPLCSLWGFFEVCSSGWRRRAVHSGRKMRSVCYRCLGIWHVCSFFVWCSIQWAVYKSIPWSDSCLVLETWCSCITNITWIMVSCFCWLLIVYRRTVLPWVHSWGIGLWQRSRPAY